MKARWLVVSLIIAFSTAFVFFQREARLGEMRSDGPALVVPAQSTNASARASVSSDTGPVSETPASRPPSATPQPPPLENRERKIENAPALLSGSFTRENDALIYDADARLRLPNDITLSAPTGVMVSNEQQTVFAGDMALETARNTIVAHEAVLDTTSGQMSATVASISFTNDHNQLVRLTGENITLELPATKPDQPTTILSDAVKVETLPPSTAPNTTNTR
jgi:hypothetical protein